MIKFHHISICYCIFIAILAFFSLSCKTEEEARAIARQKQLDKMNQEIASSSKYRVDLSPTGSRIIDRDAQKQNTVVSIPKLETMAENGNTNAQLSLGNIYYQGRAGEEVDYDKAFDYFTMAAEGGNPEAMYNLAVCYEGGFGILFKNIDKAIEWYKKAADCNVMQAQQKLAGYYENKGEFANAFKYIDMLAQNRTPAFLLKAGIWLLNGNGTTANPKAAVEYFRDAAEQGYAPAQIILAECYRAGNGVALNLEDAFYWYNRAAHCENAEAQAKVGYCYYQGIGITANIGKAVSWLKKAAEGDNPEAMNLLGFLYRKGEGVEKDPAMSKLYFSQAAERGNPGAQYELAMLELPDSPQEARQWLEKSHAAGYRPATIQLGQLLLIDPLNENRDRGALMLRDCVPQATPEELVQISMAFLTFDKDFANQLLEWAAQAGNQEAAALLDLQ